MKRLITTAVSALSMIAGAFIATMPQLHPSAAFASYTVPSWNQVCNHAYCFYNYDNGINPYTQPTAANADNPITTVFTNALPADAWGLFSESGQFPNTGPNGGNTADYEFITPSGNSQIADQSYGVKTPYCSNGSGPAWDTHVRLYPDSSLGYGALYDPYWGYFVLADTHQDHECAPKDFGYAEQAEGYVRQVMGQSNVSCSAIGYLGNGQPCVQSIQNDAWNFNNPEQGPGTGALCGYNGYRPYLTGTSTVDTQHCLENDGYATVIGVSYWSNH